MAGGSRDSHGRQGWETEEDFRDCDRDYEPMGYEPDEDDNDREDDDGQR